MSGRCGRIAEAAAPPLEVDAMDLLQDVSARMEMLTRAAVQG